MYISLKIFPPNMLSEFVRACSQANNGEQKNSLAKRDVLHVTAVFYDLIYSLSLANEILCSVAPHLGLSKANRVGLHVSKDHVQFLKVNEASNKTSLSPNGTFPPSHTPNYEHHDHTIFDNGTPDVSIPSHQPEPTPPRFG